MNNVSLYIHIPFCRKKCAYCDFYSLSGCERKYDEYSTELTNKIEYWGKKTNKIISSVYFGGGTPSVLGSKRLCSLLEAVKKNFSVGENAEITCEVNPESAIELDYAAMKSSGYNRISVGLQSADEKESHTLGRIHTTDQAKQTVLAARKGGFDNISLDLMLGIPHQTKQSLSRSVSFCAECGVEHISSYILKLEQGTPLFSRRNTLDLPDDDEQAELYLHAVSELEKHGYRQYEISNFAKKGYEGRHNLNYWQCGEYIGIGPSAHSFFKGERFYYGRSLEDFYGNKIIPDGKGGGEIEFIMLALRLKRGLVFEEYGQRYGKSFPKESLEKIKLFARHGYMELDGRRACFTPRGFLLSNSIISELL